MTPGFVVATTTWNAADLVGPFLGHLELLRAQAVLVMDYDSDDGTQDVLSSSRWVHLVRRVPFPGLEKLDPSNVTLAVARREFPDAWALFCDPDEFIASDGMDLGTVAARERWQDVDLVRLERRNMTGRRSVLADIDRAPFTSLLTLRIERRSVRTPRERSGGPLLTPWIFSAVPEKVLVRLSACHVIGAGDHVATMDSSRMLTSASARLLHYPFRSFGQFEDKVRNAREDLARNPHLPPGFAWHWRRWIDLHARGLLEDEYRLQVPADDDVDAMLASGALVEDRSVARFHAPSVAAGA